MVIVLGKGQGLDVFASLGSEWFTTFNRLLHLRWLIVGMISKSRVVILITHLLLTRRLHHGLSTVLVESSLLLLQGIAGLVDGRVHHAFNCSRSVHFHVGHLDIEWIIVNADGVLVLTIKFFPLNFSLINTLSAKRAVCVFFEESNQLIVAVVVDDVSWVATKSSNFLTVIVAKGADAANGGLLGEREPMLQHAVDRSASAAHGGRAHFSLGHFFLLMNGSLP